MASKKAYLSWNIFLEEFFDAWNPLLKCLIFFPTQIKNLVYSNSILYMLKLAIILFLVDLQMSTNQEFAKPGPEDE